jgi:HSP20 family protein
MSKNTEIAVQRTPFGVASSFGPFGMLQREIDRVFEDFGHAAWSPFGATGAAIKMDLAETKDAFEITAELPGLEEKDVDVSLSGRLLTVSGEKKAEKEQKDKNYRLVERSYGAFSRTVELPADVKADAVKASFSNGVLKVTAPRNVKTEAKKIAVEAAH